MKVTTYIICDPKAFLKIEEEWDSFVYENSDNPFLLSSFIKGFMEVNRANGWSIFIVIIKSAGNILATTPLVVQRTKLGFNSGTFLVTPTALSSDFIIREDYRKACLRHIINLLMERNFKLLDFTIDVNSPNLDEMLRFFKKRQFNVFYLNPGQAASHSLIYVNGSWDEFCNLRGRLFKKELRRYRRKLDSAGSWRVEKFETLDAHVVSEIFKVEKNSWKQEFRKKRGIEQDETLMMLIKALQSKTEQNFGLTWEVWFLYLNSQAIAYCLVLKYKRQAFILKGSHDKSWRQLYPGIFIRNEAIKSLFSADIDFVDFLTDLPYHQKWASERMRRIRIVLAKGIMAKMYLLLLRLNVLSKLVFFLKSFLYR